MIKHKLYAFTDFNHQSPFLATALHNLWFPGPVYFEPTKEAECSPEIVESIYKTQCNNPQTTAACGEVFLQVTHLHIYQKEFHMWKMKNKMLSSSWKRWNEQQ
jgi:hypothetical protein